MPRCKSVLVSGRQCCHLSCSSLYISAKPTLFKTQARSRLRCYCTNFWHDITNNLSYERPVFIKKKLNHHPFLLCFNLFYTRVTSFLDQRDFEFSFCTTLCLDLSLVTFTCFEYCSTKVFVSTYSVISSLTRYPSFQPTQCHPHLPSTPPSHSPRLPQTTAPASCRKAASRIHLGSFPEAVGITPQTRLSRLSALTSPEDEWSVQKTSCTPGYTLQSETVWRKWG